MSSGKNYCVNCEYEDATNRVTQMWKAEELGINPAELPAIWCKYHNRYIDNDKRQSVWCSAFKHY